VGMRPPSTRFRWGGRGMQVPGFGAELVERTDLKDCLMPICIKSVLCPPYSVILGSRRRPAPFPNASFTMTIEIMTSTRTCAICATSVLHIDPVSSSLIPIPTGHSSCWLRSCPASFYPTFNHSTHSDTTACKIPIVANSCKRWDRRKHPRHRVPRRAGLGNLKTS